MDALLQYDSSDSLELCESADDDDQPGKRQTAMTRSDDLNLKTRTDPAASEACIQKAAEDEVDFFGLVSEDDADAVASACTDIIYKPGKVAEKPSSLSVYVSAEMGDCSHVSVPDTAFWKGEMSTEPIVDCSETPTTACKPIHSLHQQTQSCKRSAAVLENQNNYCEQHYGYKRKQNKTEHNQSHPISKNREVTSLQCRYTVHHKIGPHLNQKSVNRIPRRKLQDIAAHGGIVNKVEWCCPEFSHLLLSASMDRTVKVWDVLSATPACVQTLRFHEKAVKDATWSASGREILSAGYDRMARICDVEKGKDLDQ